MKKSMDPRKKRKIQMGTLAVLAILVVAYFTIPGFRSNVTGIVMLFSSMSVESVIGYIQSFGIYAVVISFLLMMFQSVAAPLPAFLLTFANAAVFGWWQGAILSWSSAMAGAALCFFIARVLGRDGVEKLIGKMSLTQVDTFFEKFGKHTILICRLLPFVSFDFVSYAAGLTSIGFLGFFVATGIGQLPATIVYSYVGGMLTGGTKLFVSGLLILFALSVLVVLLRKMYMFRQGEKNGIRES